jgi:glycerol uptake facilitator-like aquaporin
MTFTLSKRCAAEFLGVTEESAPRGMAPLAIGFALTLIHLVSIPVTNTSVNPARSTGPALFVGTWAIQQLWLFWVAPIFGAIVAGVVYPRLFVSVLSSEKVQEETLRKDLAA